MEFPTFGAKALAGIGDPPGTLADRSLRFRLKRALPHERPERLLGDEPRTTGEGLCARAAAWAEENLDPLSAARPAIPEELDDRAADACLPLFAIADLVGNGWGERVRAGVIALREPEGQVDSDGVALLAAAGRAFAGAGDPEQLATADLLERLAADVEAPDGFSDDDKGRARRLARLLRPFGVRPDDIHAGAGPGRRTVKGYRRERFDDAFARYLSPDSALLSAPSAPTGSTRGIAGLSDPRRAGSRRGSANGGNPHGHWDGAVGADGSRVFGGEAVDAG